MLTEALFYVQEFWGVFVMCMLIVYLAAFFCVLLAVAQIELS